MHADIDPYLIWPLTLGQARRFGLPFLAVFFACRLIVIAGLWGFLVATAAGLIVVLGQINGVPIDAYAKNRLHHARRPRTHAANQQTGPRFLPDVTVHDGLLQTVAPPALAPRA